METRTESRCQATDFSGLQPFGSVRERCVGRMVLKAQSAPIGTPWTREAQAERATQWRLAAAGAACRVPARSNVSLFISLGTGLQDALKARLRDSGQWTLSVRHAPRKGSAHRDCP